MQSTACCPFHASPRAKRASTPTRSQAFTKPRIAYTFHVFLLSLLSRVISLQIFSPSCRACLRVSTTRPHCPHANTRTHASRVLHCGSPTRTLPGRYSLMVSYSSYICENRLQSTTTLPNSVLGLAHSMISLCLACVFCGGVPEICGSFYSSIFCFRRASSRKELQLALIQCARTSLWLCSDENL